MNKPNRNLDLRDGGFLSRKLVFGAAIILVMTLAFLAAARWNALIPVLDVFFGGLVAIYAIYCGANVGNKVGVGKSLVKLAAKPTPEPSQPVEQMPE